MKYDEIWLIEVLFCSQSDKVDIRDNSLETAKVKVLKRVRWAEGSLGQSTTWSAGRMESLTPASMSSTGEPVQCDHNNSSIFSTQIYLAYMVVSNSY